MNELLLALHNGDQDRLTVLAFADWLEESGDHRGAGLHAALSRGLTPYHDGRGWAWHGGRSGMMGPSRVDHQHFERLAHYQPGINDDIARRYGSLGNAWLAVAAAFALDA